MREVDLTDAAALTTLFKVREVSMHIDPPPATVEDFSRWISISNSRRAEGRTACFTVLTGQDEVSGLFTAQRLQDGEQCEIGFAIAPHLWGTGTFQTAFDLYREFLFTRWGIRTLIGKTQTTNVRAVSVMKKLGARLIEEVVHNGHPEYVWAIERPQIDTDTD